MKDSRTSHGREPLSTELCTDDFLPGARHGFLQQPSADTEKAVALMRDCIARL